MWKSLVFILLILAALHQVSANTKILTNQTTEFAVPIPNTGTWQVGDMIWTEYVLLVALDNTGGNAVSEEKK